MTTKPSRWETFAVVSFILCIVASLAMCVLKLAGFIALAWWIVGLPAGVALASVVITFLIVLFRDDWIGNDPRGDE